jgi:hypothetical protein
VEYIEPSALIAFARTLSGETLATAQRGARFTIQVAGDGLTVTPASSGAARPITQAELERVLDQFAASGSFAPGNYLQVSVNSSYLLTIIQRYIEQ